MKKYQITPEHKIELEKIKQKYIANALRTDAMTDHDKDMMRVAMRGLYKNANLPYPGDEKVIFVSSPLVAQFASGWAMSILYGNNSRQAEQAAIQAAEQAAINGEKSIDVFISSFVSLGEKFGKFGYFSVNFAWWYRTRSSMWPWYQVYGDFFKNVAKLPGDWDKWNPLNLDCLHGGVRFMTPDFTIISDRPEIIKIDEAGRLHCENGPAVKWRDGMEQYYWRGVGIEDRWITDKKSLTPEIALKWENAEQRRAAMEIIGWQNLLTLLNAKEIDKDQDPTVGILYEADHEALGGKCKFLKMYCPTGRWFAEPVPPEMQTALEANAWGFDIPPTLYKVRVQA